jgi:hypothetical protein
MPYTDVKDIAGGIKDCLAAAGVLVGGAWALWRFVLRRELHPKIQFDLDLHVVSREHDHLVVEVVAVVENKGIVRHWLRDFRFDLLYLPVGAPIVEGDERINRQALFEPIFKKRYWIPPDWISTFIDAGVVQRYTYLARVPKTSSMLLVFAMFRYPDSNSEFHTAQKAFSVTHDEKTPVA